MELRISCLFMSDFLCLSFKGNYVINGMGQSGWLDDVELALSTGCVLIGSLQSSQGGFWNSYHGFTLQNFPNQ